MDGRQELRRARRLAALAARSEVKTFGLVDEDGEWRIDEVPDALIVPETWFDD